MEKIIGIRFKKAGKIYDFSCGAFVLKVGDHVIVETENGLGVGTVATLPIFKEKNELTPPVKRVYRPLSEKDLERIRANLELENRAFAYCRRCIQELGLKMNLFSTESNFDANKITFYFTAADRVDFRQLVADSNKQASPTGKAQILVQPMNELFQLFPAAAAPGTAASTEWALTAIIGQPPNNREALPGCVICFTMQLISGEVV